jgi:hypothetical protein
MELLFQAILFGDLGILKILFTRQPTILENVYNLVSELKIEPKVFTFYVSTKEVQVIQFLIDLRL